MLICDSEMDSFVVKPQIFILSQLKSQDKIWHVSPICFVEDYFLI